MTTHGSFPNFRPRRNRLTQTSRAMVSETSLSVKDLIYPLFVSEDEELVGSIPNFHNTNRYNLAQVVDEVSDAYKLGIRAIILFGVIPDKLKDKEGSYALRTDNIVAKATTDIRKAFPDLIIITDIALDPYTSHGHDGILDKDGYVDNDKTCEYLKKQALTLAKAGADTIAPSDMMDGRVGFIRQALDKEKLINVRIMSYTAKYCSKLYGPFRNAVKSSSTLIGDKKNYQMDYANSDEAIIEASMDISEGADWLIVKPGIFYLDVISKLRSKFLQPIFAYQVSGEYQMLWLAANQGLFDFDEILYEAMISFKRAGASGIITYGAKEIASYLQSQPSS